MKIHKRIRVTGKVQGVYFRVFTQVKALELGIKGIVKNQSDGSVYIEAEGEEFALLEFIEWCGHGPPSAKVAAVEVGEGELKQYQSFDIVINS